jgi:hypothetical protein
MQVMKSPDREAECASGRVKASAEWVDHFRGNREREWHIPWHRRCRLGAATLARIAGSIAEFQRGESSEALHYLAKSMEFSTRIGDEDFHAASILFVREENGHAALLSRFMQHVGIPARKAVFSDGIFRWLRGFSDLGWSSRVLIIAELIAQEYYPCLRVSTDHPELVRICDKIVFDEEAHIQFQVERIAMLEQAVSPPLVALRDALQTILMAGAACVVYAGHRPVLRARLDCGSFLARTFRRNRAAIAAMRTLRLDSIRPGQVASLPVQVP